MKNTSKAAKFFIVCAVIFGIGLLTTILGAAFGGVDGFKKVANERGWTYDGPGELVMDYSKQEDFNAVDVQGDVDLYLVSEKSFKDKGWQKEHDLDDSIIESALVTDSDADPTDENGRFTPAAGCVLIAYGDKVEKPEIKVVKGVLHIDAERDSINGINLDFSSVPVTPAVYVFCKDEELKNIKANTLSGDISLYGITFGTADITSASGDTLMKDVSGETVTLNLMAGDAKVTGNVSKNSSLKVVDGDVDMSGKFLGITDIDSTSGDVDFNSELGSDKYALNISAVAGDVNFAEGDTRESFDEIPVNIERKGGPNTLKIEATSGDIDLSFGK